jgi:hypothetical protein
MNKTIIQPAVLALLLIFTFTVSVNAQETKRTFGVGLQASFPTYGLSAKYAITDASVVQATIAPFGVSSGGSSASLTFYGLRYVHRFPGEDGTAVVLDPYLFAGGGLINYKENNTAYGGSKTSQSYFGYSAGGGVEAIFGNAFGISAELGYGKLSFTDGIAVNSLIFGVGLHYYIR